MHEMLQRTLGSAIDLRLDLNAKDEHVLADSTQLELALLNLAINARDALDTDGLIIIRTAHFIVDRPGPDIAEGRYVTVSVIDNGAGMPEEVRAKAFDPFFTTKPVGKGTGLGLSQVYGFARQLGGTARIESQAAQGTTVSILLPCIERRAELNGVLASYDVAPESISATVLVVDDDAAVRRVAVDALEAAGHMVSQASDGVQALAEMSAAEPDVVVVDYAMPGMTGAELAVRIRERWPHMKIIFVTGYADIESVKAMLGADQLILRKPYHFDALVTAVGDALRREQSE